MVRGFRVQFDGLSHVPRLGLFCRSIISLKAL